MSRAESWALASCLVGFGCRPGEANSGEDETVAATESGATDETGDEPQQGCVGDPTRVVALDTANHTCALFDSGHVKCWGPNHFGHLGLGHTQTIGDDELPADVPFVELDRCATALAVSSRGHNCAVLDDGTVQCWGRNELGELGLGHTETIGDDELPVTTEPLVFSSPAIAVSVASATSCALLANGDISCWGSNLCGRLGFTDAPFNLGDDEPVTGVVVEQKSTASDVVLGELMSCLIDPDGWPTCWAASASEDLGHLPPEPPAPFERPNNYGCGSAPADAPPHRIASPVVDIAIGNTHACALDVEGQLWCWGGNLGGELGYGNTSPLIFSEVPVDVGAAIDSVDSTGDTTCVLSFDQRVRCWGRGSFGKLGGGNEETIGDDEVPASVDFIDVGADVTAVAAGIAHTCVITTDAEVRCWGSGADGRLGLGHELDVGDDELPSSVGPVPLL